MISGFKDFVLRGNVIDLAIAVVIGMAFSAIVSAISTDVLGNLVAAVVGDGQIGRLGVDVPNTAGRTTTVVFGTTVAAVINFLVVAAVLYFLVVVPMNRLLALRKEGEEPDAAAPAEDVLLLQEIRDLLRRQQGLDGPTSSADPSPSSEPSRG